SSQPVNAFYLPTTIEHYFRANSEALSFHWSWQKPSDTLSISCRRRFDSMPQSFLLDETIYPVILDDPSWHIRRHEIIGTFMFTGCRGRAEIDDTDIPWQLPLQQPEDTFNVEMALSSTGDATDLTLLVDNKTEVLGDLDSPFRFLAPQENEYLGKMDYPFV